MTTAQPEPLIGLRCVQCDNVHFPPRSACPGCHERQFTQQALTSGTVEQTTTVLTGITDPTAPVQIASVLAEDGLVICARVRGAEPKIGDTVTLTLESGSVTARPAYP